MSSEWRCGLKWSSCTGPVHPASPAALAEALTSSAVLLRFSEAGGAPEGGVKPSILELSVCVYTLKLHHML